MTIEQLINYQAGRLGAVPGILAVFTKGNAGPVYNGQIFDGNSSDAVLLHEYLTGLSILITSGEHEWAVSLAKDLVPSAFTDDDIPSFPDNKGGAFYQSTERFGHIHMRTPSFNVLAHESYHALGWVSDQMGMPKTEQTEEFFCYYEQFIVRSYETVVNDYDRNNLIVKLFS